MPRKAPRGGRARQTNSAGLRLSIERDPGGRRHDRTAALERDDVAAEGADAPVGTVADRRREPARVEVTQALECTDEAFGAEIAPRSAQALDQHRRGGECSGLRRLVVRRQPEFPAQFLPCARARERREGEKQGAAKALAPQHCHAGARARRIEAGLPRRIPRLARLDEQREHLVVAPEEKQLVAALGLEALHRCGSVEARGVPAYALEIAALQRSAANTCFPGSLGERRRA